ncbi:hypothetical protein N5K37_22000 [Delftia tsuruhatensis]|uniref:Uncharacterized protein n=1 Tax=Delftia tsuruhatensis TaxID=180282 RepID=A0ABN4SFW2_9BURK|nr:hypothetical protein [Delftia tsuruhatensis]AOV00364.1 hypothetical protein BI380_02805 [Delftia tsuruhatensis]MDH2232581.1 hypothetical protein [Delftia tsuruhatensis]WQM80356.1 hypothetical protein RNT40_16675 [Delftia tsuruhatensis]
MEVKAGQQVWISQHALSIGVAVDRIERLGIDPDYVWLREHKFAPYRIGKDVHTSRADAAAAAESARKKKLASLQRQIQKLEALKF